MCGCISLSKNFICLPFFSCAFKDFGEGEIAYCNPVSAKAIDASRALAVEPALLCKAMNAKTTVMKGEHRAQSVKDSDTVHYGETSDTSKMRSERYCH